MDDANIHEISDSPRTLDQVSSSATEPIRRKSPTMDFESKFDCAYDSNVIADINVDLSFETFNPAELFPDLGVGVDIDSGEGSDATSHRYFHRDPNAFARANYNKQARWMVNEPTGVIAHAIQADNGPNSPPLTSPVLLSIAEPPYAPTDPGIPITSPKSNWTPQMIQYDTIADLFVDPPGAASMRALEDKYPVPTVGYMTPVYDRVLPHFSPTPESAMSAFHQSELFSSNESLARPESIAWTVSVPQAKPVRPATPQGQKIRNQPPKANPRRVSAQEDLMKQFQLQAAEQQRQQPRLRDARYIIAEQKLARKRRLDQSVLKEPDARKRTCRKSPWVDEPVSAFAEEVNTTPVTPTSAHQYADLPLIPSLSDEPPEFSDSIPEFVQQRTPLRQTIESNQQIMLHPEPPLKDADVHIIRTIISYIDCPTTKDSFMTIGAVDTYWINNATHTVWNTMRLLPAAYNLQVREQLQNHAVMFPYEKCQVLNRAGILGIWWWLRETLIEYLHRQQTSINDSAMVTEWKGHWRAIKNMHVHVSDVSAVVEGVTGFCN